MMRWVGHVAGREEKSIQDFDGVSWWEEDHLEDLSTNGWKILL
jgi:hypothetical protein